MPEFEFEKTEDGSRTVRIREPNGTLSEAMHSLKGAFSETDYIYGRAIRTCLELKFPRRILSMGLGLGYNEILAAALFVANDGADSLSGESFEIIPELREYFLAWLGNSVPAPREFSAVYEEILARSAALVDAAPKVVKSALASAIRRGAWRVSGALESETQFSDRFGCICFDAFSSKTSPQLWTEPFLKSFLDCASATCCVLSTYACTGALKRALRECHFEIHIREGFASKRDSTFALRTDSRP